MYFIFYIEKHVYISEDKTKNCTSEQKFITLDKNFEMSDKNLKSIYRIYRI